MSTSSTPSRGTGEPTKGGTPRSGEPQETERLREDIAATRAELGDTVEALAAKGDVKARAKGKVAEVKAAAGEQAGQAAQTAKIKAAEAGRQVHDKISDVTAKAKETTGSPQAARVARLSGAAAAVAAGAALVWAWRRRVRRNVSPWQRAARAAKSQLKTVRGGARTQAEVARRQVQRQAKAGVTTAKARAKAARVRAKHLR
ncbi:DUF3618 domain-containing protein [Actinomadura scrupuli]|uniref:DUF3618 domain-containing protein n=1 Tax=Actinomadura scrupuli TaxID=559629 RepID=UPI003D99BB12